MRIRQVVVDAIIDHASETAPAECCGLLIGTVDGIEDFRRARNLDARPTRYRVDPADHFAAIRHARRVGWEVVGAYHSHPATRAVPSPSDLREATYAGYLYVIVSLSAHRGAGVEGYRLHPGGYDRVPLEPVL